MNNIINRRRIFGSSSEPQYAVTAADNPGWMDYLYHRGFTASSDYCTMEEAAAVTTFSTTPQHPVYTPNTIPHTDLRWFVNTADITPGGKRITKITLPAVSELQNIAPGYRFHGSTVNGSTYTVILPKKVTKFDPWFIDGGNKNCIYVIENPEIVKWDKRESIKPSGTGSVLGIYVPDASVNLYKNTNEAYDSNTYARYSQYADVIFPISQYSE